MGSTGWVEKPGGSTHVYASITTTPTTTNNSTNDSSMGNNNFYINNDNIGSGGGLAQTLQQIHPHAMETCEMRDLKDSAEDMKLLSCTDDVTGVQT